MPYKQDNSILIVGERLNASGSKKVRELLNNDDWDGMAQCLRGKRQAERQYSESVSYKCYKGMAELELNIDGSKSIKKLILE